MKRAWAFSLAVITITGCGSQASSLLGEESEALGEASCGYPPSGLAVDAGGVDGGGGTPVPVYYATAPACLSSSINQSVTGYGSATQCPSQFLLEYSSTVPGASYVASVAPAGFFIASAASCALLTATIGVYNYDNSTNMFSYHHGITTVGSYVASTKSCMFQTTPVSSAVPFRIATSMTYTYMGTTTFRAHYSRLARLC